MNIIQAQYYRFKDSFVSERQYLQFVFLLALIIRLATIINIGNLESPELYEHGFIARNMLNGHGYSMHWPYTAHSTDRLILQSHPPEFGSSFIPPLNPLIIYGFMFIFGDNPSSYFALMFLYAICSSLIAVVTYYLAKRIVSDGQAKFAGIFAAVFLPAAYSVTTFSASALFQLFGMLSILMSLKSIREPNIKNYSLLGLVCALQTLLRAEFLLLSILLFIASLYYSKKNHRTIINTSKILILLASFIVVYSAIVMPWVIRNTMLFKKVVPIVSHPWHEIWRGNNELSTGGSINTKGTKLWLRWEDYPELIKKMDSLPYNQNFELATDSVLKKEVIKYWREQPVQAISKMALRAFFVWGIDFYNPKTRDIKYAFFVLLATIPFIFGLWALSKKSKKTMDYSSFTIISLFFAYYTLLFGIANIEPRYQVYILTISIILSGSGWMYLYNKFLNKQLKK